jgi:hypothetical protein
VTDYPFYHPPENFKQGGNTMKFSTAMDKEKSRVMTHTVALGTNMTELAAKVGEQVVFESAVDSIVIAIQAGVRRLMRAGKTDEEINTWVANYKPGVRGPRVAKVMTPDEILKALEAMPKEQRDAILAVVGLPEVKEEEV